MFSTAAAFPQLTVPIAHVGPFWNALRSAAQNVQFSKPRAASYRTSSGESNKSHQNKPVAAEELTEGVKDTLRALGLGELTPGLKVHEIHPSLPKVTVPSDVSASTFFENKNGFPERLLTQTSYSETPTAYSVIIPALGTRRPLLSAVPTGLLNLSRGLSLRSRGKDGTNLGVGMKPHTERAHDSFTLAATDISKSKEKGNENISKHIEHQVSNLTPRTDREKNGLELAAHRGYQLGLKQGKEDRSTTWKGYAARWLIISGVLLLLWSLMMRSQGSLGGGDMKFSMLSKGFQVDPEKMLVTFDDVKGVAEAKQELQDIVEFLRDPEKFKAVGARIPKGVLLVGPPGIGKTLLARAVAGEAGVPFFRASGSEFDEVFVGTGARRVRQLFASAKVQAPCVIFIDEIDSVGGKRSSTAIHPYANQTINQLLTEMDGFTDSAGVIVLGATNRRDHLDQAILRPGRFDVEVRVYPPDREGRVEILDYYLGRVKVSPSVDVDQLARGTTGCSGADLENLVNQAAIKAALDNSPVVRTEHIEYARDKIFMGPAKKTRIQDEETNENTAYHEAGHTVVAHYTKEATPLHKVTIIPRGMSLGHTSFVPKKDQYGMTRGQLMAQMDVAMGGRVGEEIIFGADRVTTGASADFQSATDIATAMVKIYGMSEKVGVRVVKEEAMDSGLSFVKVGDLSPAAAELVDNEIKRLLQESMERARTILKTHTSEHRALAQTLLEFETLDADQIKTVLNGKTLKKPSKNPPSTSNNDGPKSKGPEPIPSGTVPAAFVSQTQSNRPL